MSAIPNPQLRHPVTTMFACLALFVGSHANALELPHLVGDAMVVQRDQPIPVWGWAAAGSEIMEAVRIWPSAPGMTGFSVLA